MQLQLKLMLFLTFLLASLAAAGLGPMTGENDAPGLWGGYPIEPMCFEEDGFFPLKDAQDLANNLKTQDPENLNYIQHDNSIHSEQGLIRICVNNDFLTHDTHVLNKDVGENLQKIIDKCCKPEEDYCRGGYRQGTGRNGGIFIDYVTRGAGKISHRFWA
ncbi:MAG: hypothetical protein Q9226_004382 [Calogaya cf. arnoldii]